MQNENAGVESEAAAQTESDTTEHGGENKMVPLEALQSIRDEVKELKNENRSLRENVQTYSNHFEMMAAQQKQQQPKEADPLEGLADDDYLTAGQARKFAEQMSNYSSQLARQTQASNAELKMMAEHADYKEIIKDYLPKAIEEDPELLQEIKSASNQYKYAYKMAKKSQAYLKDQAKKTMSPKSQKVFDNYTQPQSLSSAGAPVKANGEGKYRSMNQADFRKLVAKNSGLI